MDREAKETWNETDEIAMRLATLDQRLGVMAAKIDQARREVWRLAEDAGVNLR